MSPENLSTLILLGSFLAMILLRFPIAYAVGISTALCLLSMGQSLVSLPQLMVKGVWSFSLMAVQYTAAGTASTLMAMTPIIILLPSYWLFHEKITWKAVAGAVISVIGVSLFFLEV